MNIHWTDIIPWSRLGSVGGTLLSVVLVWLGHYSHSSILTKASADSSTNWAVVYCELGGGLLCALVSIVASIRATKGMTAVSLKTAVPELVSSPEDTSDTLLDKLRHRFKVEAVEAMKASILKGGDA